MHIRFALYSSGVIVKPKSQLSINGGSGLRKREYGKIFKQWWKLTEQT